MRLFRWIMSWWDGSHTSEHQEPLREFIYLDEVSLRSLLSSQTGEMTDTTSKQIAGSHEVEVGSSAAAAVPQVGSSELKSRFQTSNSSSLQTSRKATVQSWFREFYSIPNLRLVEPSSEICNFSDTTELTDSRNTSTIIKSNDLERGKLVEFRIRLAPDPIFHLGTMVSEFTGMAEDYPGMFTANNALETLNEVQPINRILQRLLAGLIPVRAEAIDYSVIDIDGIEYIVHRDSIAGLNLIEKPLVIVGVTEHLAYWKDIRRVLFSEAEFTALCRVSRSGLQPSWTPVKLADLFRDLVPDLVEQMNAAGKSPFLATPAANKAVDADDECLVRALNLYKSEILSEAGKELSADQEFKVDNEIFSQLPLAKTASGQRAAFRAVKEVLTDLVGIQLASPADLELRERCRQLSGLRILPTLNRDAPAADLVPANALDVQEPRLLDVDFVAIYW